MDDGQIVKLYFNREERAIRETARKYAAYCHSIAYRILESHPDAEEVVNDTYLGAWNSIPPTKPLSLSAYLGKISRRLALNRWRSGQRKNGAGERPLWPWRSWKTASLGGAPPRQSWKGRNWRKA